MMNAATLGNLTLNLAFVLYLIVYVPQIRHNKNAEHLAELSTSLHMILMASFVLDLAYGFLKPLPWQYRAVSVVALSLLTIQHMQLMRLAQTRRQLALFRRLSFFGLGLILMLAGMFYIDASVYSNKTIFWIGWISRIGFLSYTLPQIIQNHRLNSAQALSTTYLNLSLFLSLLDLISAWCLDWGWPNKLGTPFTISLTLILLWQKNALQTGFKQKQRGLN